MKKVYLVNGPNLGLLGKREPEKYGNESLEDIESRLKKRARAAGLELQTFQSESEGALISEIHRYKEDGASGIILNAGGYTHTSVALRDALLAVEAVFVEVHITNPHSRESFRHVSMLTDIALGQISGLGTLGYDFALEYLINKIKSDI